MERAATQFERAVLASGKALMQWGLAVADWQWRRESEWARQAGSAALRLIDLLAGALGFVVRSVERMGSVAGTVSSPDMTAWRSSEAGRFQ